MNPYPVSPGWWFLLDDELPPGCDAEIFERDGICAVQFEPFDFEIVSSIASRSACICPHCGRPIQVCDRCRKATPAQREEIRAATIERYLKERPLS